MRDATGDVVEPLLLSTWSFGQPANAAGWPVLASGGAALDAVELAARHAEADPDNRTVGYGGLPDRSGRVSLDASIMLAPSRRGAVAFVRDVVHVVSLARRVMEKTPHVLLAGGGAERFAEAEGFPRTDLLTESSRRAWQEWLQDLHGRQSGLVANIEEKVLRQSAARSTEERQAHDTIGVLGLDASGTLAGACTTSGMPWKLPGRVGDSPIVGHGLYVDPRHGAAVCTGHGELVMGVCGSFLAVECLRRGGAPADAARAVVDRIVESYELTEEDQVGVIVLTPRGAWSAAALRPGFRVAVKTRRRDELVEPEHVVFPR